MELTRAQHEELGGAFEPSSLIGGFVEGLNGLYLPPTMEQVQGKCTRSWVNVFDAVGRKTSTLSGVYVYKDSEDAAAEFSVKPGVVDYGGRRIAYNGQVAQGPLSLGATNYIWLDLTVSPVVAAFGAALPAGIPHVALATIAMPSTGHWLPSHLTMLATVQTLVSGGGGVSRLKATFTYGSSSSIALGTVAAGTLVIERRIIVLTPFSGSAPTLDVGDAGDADRLVAAASVNLKGANTYIIPGGYRYNAETALLGTYMASGSTAGEAIILLDLA